MATLEIPGKYETAYFRSSLDHVLAELRLMALKLQMRVKKYRQSDSSGEAEQFKGLFISEKEIDDILSDPEELQQDSSCLKASYSSEAEEALLKRWNNDISSRKESSIGRGQKFRLDILQELFGLSQIELDILLICLLSEIDSRYQKLFAYLQDDITKKYPTIDLILRFLGDFSTADMLRIRECFTLQASLVKYHLISLHDSHLSEPAPLLARFIHLDERVAGYLLDGDLVDSRLTSLVSLNSPQKKWADLIIPEDIKSRLYALALNNNKTSLVCCLSGDYGAAKRDIAEAICAELGMSMLTVNMKSLLISEIPADILISLIFREGLLQNTAIYLDGFDLLLSENKETIQIYNSTATGLRAYPLWVILGSEKEWRAEGVIGDKPCINVKLNDATYAERTQIWKRVVGNGRGFAPDIDICGIANKFRFNSGQISQVTAAARNLAKWRDPTSGLVTGEDLYTACRRHSGEALSTLTRKIQPSYTWEDIILPKDQMEYLHEICRYVEHYHTVYDSWGFGRKLSLGKGLNVLFAGPSGTGKTMAAEVIANGLKIDLYKIDLSVVVSKYIGETEKNLDKIFREGQTSNAILFFDEADALFGKRSEVRDSHDRYANIETAYLLQKMDEYEGIVILATNLRKNMDEAFARRMHYTVDFPVPEEPERYRIWQNIFPKEVPVSAEFDLAFMAKQFKITGGNIKNIALNAAFLAVDQGGSVNMEHLIRATKREYQKTGKLCVESDFGKYFEMVKS